MISTRVENNNDIYQEKNDDLKSLCRDKRRIVLTFQKFRMFKIVIIVTRETKDNDRRVMTYSEHIFFRPSLSYSYLLLWLCINNVWLIHVLYRPVFSIIIFIFQTNNRRFLNNRTIPSVRMYCLLHLGPTWNSSYTLNES